MTIKIKLHDFETEYLPFSFQGFMNEGFCYLKIKIINNQAIFLCSQLPDYHGTSVTNAVETIRNTIIEKLINDNKISIDIKFGTFEKFFKNNTEINEMKNKELNKFISKNSIWIEHYPEGVGILSQGSYSIVDFSDDGTPTWSYFSKESLVKEYPNINLDLSIEELKQWNS